MSVTQTKAEPKTTVRDTHNVTTYREQRDKVETKEVVDVVYAA
jgi:hypothetical protein